MPLPEHHVCRLREPDEFTSGSFRTLSKDSEGKPYQLIIGRLKGKRKTTDQAYRYPIAHWTVSEAREHCGRHNGLEFEPAEIEGSASDQPGDIERRYVWETPDVRVEDRDGQTVLRGYAAVFESLSHPMPFGREIISRGAFGRVLKSKQDVAALFNHEADHLLGRRSSGTLQLAEDDKGLAYEIELGDTQLDDFVHSRIERRDITGSSFAFTIKTENVKWDDDPKKTVRRLVEVDRLYDVGPVTFPAYPATKVKAGMAERMLAEWRSLHTVEPATEADMEHLRRRLELEEAELGL